jgi:hypothetical protein
MIQKKSPSFKEYVNSKKPENKWDFSAITGGYLIYKLKK